MLRTLQGLHVLEGTRPDQCPGRMSLGVMGHQAGEKRHKGREVPEAWEAEEAKGGQRISKESREQNTTVSAWTRGHRAEGVKGM